MYQHLSMVEVAQFLAVCSRLKWSGHLTHPPLSRPARNGWVSGRVQDYRGLLTRRQLTKVPQALDKRQRAWQMRLAEASQHPPGGLEQREQTLSPMLVHVPACLCFLRMIAERMHVARHGPVQHTLAQLCHASSRLLRDFG